MEASCFAANACAASDSSHDGCRGRKWRSRAARTLHHRIGHAFRVARRDLESADYWVNGLHLARHMAHWSVILDQQMGADEDQAVQESVKQRRTLSVHLSEVTTAADDASVATTEQWSQDVRNRKPRHRPHRRVNRRMRLQWEEDMARKQHESSAAQLDYDMGRFPLHMMSCLAACLEEDLQDDAEVIGGGAMLSGCDIDCDSHSSHRGHDEQQSNHNYTQQASISNHPSHAEHESHQCDLHNHGDRRGCGLKRKFATADLVSVDRYDESEEKLKEEEAPSNCARADESHGTAPTLEDFYEPIGTVLERMRSLLSNGQPAGLMGISQLRHGIKSQVEALSKSLCVRPRYGLIKAGEVIELLRTEIVERDTPGYHEYATPPGLHAWCQELSVLESTYEELAAEDRDAAVEEVQYDMEMHLGTIQYCLDSYEELLDAERENLKGDQILLEQAVWHRLAASLASRV
jgi:hypothetical protein